MRLRRARVPVTPVLSNLLTALLGGAGIWWWLLTSQSGSSEPCLKGPIWHLSCGGAPESLEEPPVLLIFIRRGVMRNSLADSSERLAPLLISADAHFDIKKQRRPRPPSPATISSRDLPVLFFRLLLPLPPRVIPASAFPGRTSSKCAALTLVSPLNERQQAPPPPRPLPPSIPLKQEKQARF